MRRSLHFVVLSIMLISAQMLPAQSFSTIASPDGRLRVEFAVNARGEPVYQVKRDDQTVLQESRLGLVRDDADFSGGLRLVGESEAEVVEDHYEILNAKRRFNTYRANRKVFRLATSSDQRMDVIFQISNDGAAFRYRFPEESAAVHTVEEELSSFHFLPDTKAWLQPMSVAKSGWRETNPSYEEYYEKEFNVGTPSILGAGWVFPALFRTGETWVLISETALDRDYCGTRLRHESPGGEYTIGFPDPRETMYERPANPSATLPWLTPWRVIAIGSLKTIGESTLGIDLANPARLPHEPWMQPGKASWSWPLLGDGQTNYETQKRFIDYAAEMGWPYCLIDALWDVQIGYDGIEELAAYARTKGVGLLLWYNSNGNWNQAPQTPKDRMVTRETRAEEFARLQAIGIRGLKVDFFGGDGQPVIQYYLDIIEDAARYELMLNFHGCTLPRGWQRTYPHLMTMESVRGLEFVTFEQANADEEPSHATMLPFTRNVFDPMDFTPVVLDRIRRIERRTTSGFELALAVLFTSGIQHYAEIPAGMAKMPDYVRDFLTNVPAVWEDVRFIDGYPGRLVVMARQGGGRWYVAGINGEDREKQLTLDLSFLPDADAGFLIREGEAAMFARTPARLDANKQLTVTLKPHGGFVLAPE